MLHTSTEEACEDRLAAVIDDKFQLKYAPVAIRCDINETKKCHEM